MLWVKALCCFMTTHVPVLITSLKPLFNNSVGSSSITHHTASSLHLLTMVSLLILELESWFWRKVLLHRWQDKHSVFITLSPLVASFHEEGIIGISRCDNYMNKGGRCFYEFSPKWYFLGTPFTLLCLLNLNWYFCLK